jgi:hypothetical protein
MSTQSVTLHLPSELVRHAKRTAKARHQPLEKVLTDALETALPNVPDTTKELPREQALEAFEREVAAYERLKPELLKQYAGRVVAIYQERVVAVGDNEMDVLGDVYERIGHVPCYIEWAKPDAPRRVRMTSMWVKRNPLPSPISPNTR